MISRSVLDDKPLAAAEEELVPPPAPLVPLAGPHQCNSAMSPRRIPDSCELTEQALTSGRKCKAELIPWLLGLGRALRAHDTGTQADASRLCLCRAQFAVMVTDNTVCTCNKNKPRQCCGNWANVEWSALPVSVMDTAGVSQALSGMLQHTRASRGEAQSKNHYGPSVVPRK
eukprot:324213-Rhodomonas_salina.1